MNIAIDPDTDAAVATSSDPPWDYLAGLPRRLEEGGHSVPVFRDALTDGDALLKQRFESDESVECLVRDRARLVDVLLRTAWTMHMAAEGSELALIAVGG